MAARRSRQAIRLYFYAQIVNAVVVFAAVRLVGDHAHVYALLYAAVTLPVLECCCFLIVESRLSLTLYMASISFGLLSGVIAASNSYRHVVDDYVTFVEGVMLSIIGTSLLLTNAHRDRLAASSIGTLCVALSCYDFAYFRNDDWSVVNGWLPSAMCSATFAYVAWKGQGESDGQVTGRARLELPAAR